MFELKIPSALMRMRRYGLLLADDQVQVVSWQRGSLTSHGRFSNDHSGRENFRVFAHRNKVLFRDRPFHILINVVGEDYRFEKVAHLVGKYRSDFHNRRIQRLFRGADYATSFVQGREEMGRREDLVLFYGLLSKEKVTPWVQDLSATGATIGSVNSLALIGRGVYDAVGASSKKDASVLLVAMHEGGVMRQSFYIGGHIRFSRVSKVQFSTAEQLGSVLQRELERTLQYLTSLKISIASGGMDIHVIVQEAMTSSLKQMMESTERHRFHFHGAETVAKGMGITKPMGELGADSTLWMHTMFSRFRLKQLMRFNVVRYYYFRLGTAVTALVLAIYAILQSVSVGLEYASIRLELIASNQKTQEDVDLLRSQYDAEVARFGTPPSSPVNMRSVSNVFEYLGSNNFSPTPLLLYASRAMEVAQRAGGLSVRQIRWWLANPVGDGQVQEKQSDGLGPYLTGEEVYQVLEVYGEFNQRENEELDALILRAKGFVDSFESRSDIEVRPIKIPAKKETDFTQGQIGGETNLEEVKDREFIIRIVWRQVSEDRLKIFFSEEEEDGEST